MGRHRKSIEERLQDGTYRPTVHGPIDGRVSDLPPMDTEESPPDQLTTEYARRVWRDLLPIASAKGILTLGERELFIIYCELAGLFDQACREIKAHGAFVKIAKKTGAGGRQRAAFDDGIETALVRSPWMDIRRECAADLMQAAKLLGLTAVDRCRVVKAKEIGESVPTVRPRTALDRARIAAGT